MQVRLTTDTNYRRSKGGSISRPEKSEGVARSPFLQILDEVLPPEKVGADGDLHELWQELPDVERELLNHPSNENLRRYRDVALGIARATLRRNARVKKIRRRNRKGEMIELSLVEFVDDRLQKMAHMLSAPGNSAWFMLKTVEEIRGMLLDVRE